MARSTPVLRRYTPPTCTLEILAQDSALSRWATQPVLKNLRFRLSLDDPKLPSEHWVAVAGDRAQLAALCDVVAAYVQNLLVASGDRLAAPPTPSNSASDSATVTLARIDLQTAIESTPNDFGIWLQPQGLLNHELHWGELAPASAAITQLSTIQLFDLANALDEYAADVLDLPTLQRQGWVSRVPNWAQIAAIVLVAVGLSTSAIKLLEGSAGNVASSPAASSSDQKIATQIPPAIVQKATPPVVSGQTLPAPTAISPAAPQPGSPTVVTPKAPKASPPSEANSSETTIATYPVPNVPGNPTIVGEAAPATKPQRSAPAPLATAPEAADVNSAIAMRQRAAARGENAAPNTAGSTAFDTIPQVAEVRSYFQQRWNPPEGLAQTLEYSLKLDADGKIQSITPLRQASGEYIDRTGIPLVGDSFVSPLQGRQSAKVRLVLEPSGQVQAFLEE